VTDAELVVALDKLKAMMISVATGGPQIQHVENAFVQTFDDVERSFNFGYRLGDGGMRNLQPGGRLCHAASIGNRHQDMKVA
jgi:hypothetical protein